MLLSFFQPGIPDNFCEAGGVGSSCHNYNALWFDVEKRQGQGSLDISKNFFIRPLCWNITSHQAALKEC